MKYKFTYKKIGSFFWKIKTVIGHGIDFAEEVQYDAANRIAYKLRKPLDAMLLYFEDGSVERIAQWSSYNMKLGTDWKIALKEKMEQETNQNVKLVR